jgi:hypothetical protein
MYELNRKKSNGYRIILGIIIFAFISVVFKIALNKTPTSLNDDLIKAANEINSHAPVILDSTTRFDRVDALSNNVFQYNYTLLTLEKSEVDTIQLKSSARQSMIKQTKDNPKSSVFRDNGIVIQAKYFDKKGDYVTTVSVSPNEY